MSEEHTWIDDCFRVEKGKFLWNSFTKEGIAIISAINEEQCISATRFYLKERQDRNIS